MSKVMTDTLTGKPCGREYIVVLLGPASDGTGYVGEFEATAVFKTLRELYPDVRILVSAFPPDGPYKEWADG